MKKVRVLFVCLGNICRSPTAEGVFRAKIQSAGLTRRIEIESAGTGDWFVGKPPDKRAQRYASQAGYDLSKLKGRQVSSIDFHSFDYILAMDKTNLEDLSQMKPEDYAGYLGLFLDFDTKLRIKEVPDPYRMGEPAFRNALKLIERGCDALLVHIQENLSA